jgi:hypothetical protein
MTAMQNKINQLEEALKNKNNWCKINRGSTLVGAMPHQDTPSYA